MAQSDRMTAVRLGIALALTATQGLASGQTEKCPEVAAKAVPSEIYCQDKDRPNPAQALGLRRGRYATPIEIGAPPPLAETPSPAAPVLPDSRPSHAAPPSPAPVTSCDPGGCWDINGARYNAIGSRMMRSDGKVCQQVGATMQCN